MSKGLFLPEMIWICRPLPKWDEFADRYRNEMNLQTVLKSHLARNEIRNIHLPRGGGERLSEALVCLPFSNLDLNKSIVIDTGDSSREGGIAMFRTAVKVQHPHIPIHLKESTKNKFVKCFTNAGVDSECLCDSNVVVLKTTNPWFK